MSCVAHTRLRFDPPLAPCTLTRRYKRFLADVELPGGARVTAHCPNTGAMTGCSDPGSAAWLSVAANPKRKYLHTLEIVRTAAGDVGVNTARANRLVEEALDDGVVGELAEYVDRVREVKVPDERGRFDFLLSSPDRLCFVEVKSMTLALPGGRGAFPDVVSARAERHVLALARAVERGHRAVLVFCVQHTGIHEATVADHIDPRYAAALRGAHALGVEVVALACAIAPDCMRVTGTLPVVL